MLFTSYSFVFFTLAVAAVYYIVPSKWQNVLLFGASCWFYWYTMPRFLPLLLASAALCWGMGLLLQNKQLKGRKALFIATLLMLLAPLLYYKYCGFFVNTASALLGLSLKAAKLALPLGISFYTFQTVGYVIDCYNGSITAEKNPVNCMLFISFFPQLLSGPIGRAKHLLPQYAGERSFDIANLREAGARYLSGLFKKVVVADNLGRAVDFYYVSPGSYPNAAVTLFVVCCYALQIYFDFVGYSDMAIAAARVFCIELPENFNTPFLATNMSGYWKRWHMSLTGWLTDYVFTPLVWSRWGNKLLYGKKWQNHKPVTLINLAIVFLLSGIWHDATLNFVIWGLMHTFFRLVEELLHRWRKPAKKEAALKVNAKRLVVFLLSVVSHIPFRADSLGTALEVMRYSVVLLPLKEMVWAVISFVYTVFGSGTYGLMNIALLVISTALAWWLDLRMFRTPAKEPQRAVPVLALPEWARVAVCAFMYIAVILIGQFGASGFIYFNF